MTWQMQAVEMLLGMSMLGAGLVLLVGYAVFKHDQRAEEIESMDDEEPQR